MPAGLVTCTEPPPNLFIPYHTYENNNDVGARPILVLRPPPTRVLYILNESIMMHLCLDSDKPKLKQHKFTKQLRCILILEDFARVSPQVKTIRGYTFPGI
jgi:hypothetical protein